MYCHISHQIDAHLRQLDADEELEDLAEAAGMTTEEFRAECERINEANAREAAFAD